MRVVRLAQGESLFSMGADLGGNNGTSLLPGAATGEAPAGVWLPEQGVATYRGRG